MDGIVFPMPVGWTTMNLRKFVNRKLPHTSGCDPGIEEGEYIECCKRHLLERFIKSKTTITGK